MGPGHSHAYQQVKATMQRNRIPMVPLTRQNFSRHIPNVHLAEGNEALVDVNAGILYADRALKTARVRVLGTELAGPGGADANASIWMEQGEGR